LNNGEKRLTESILPPSDDGNELSRTIASTLAVGVLPGETTVAVAVLVFAGLVDGNSTVFCFFFLTA
jgi:hypothetical protein